MASNYPTSLDNFTNPTAEDSLNSDTVPHADQHANLNDAVEALQAKVGADSSAVTSSLDYRVGQLEAVSTVGANLVYNGAMQVAQRGTSVAGITGTAYHTVDRWVLPLYTLGTWTQSVENDAPTGSGFLKSLKMLCTTADSSPAAGDLMAFQQHLEGQDLLSLKKGTSDAEQLTLSFWVKSNVTGTYIAELSDNDNNRHVAAAYSVVASGTWEKKTITFPADTTGVLDNDNGNSFSCTFWLGAGSDYSSGTLSTSWASTTAANRAAGQTNLAAATSNYWQITGVQLEVGSDATDFQHRSYGEELALCQRYYESFWSAFTGWPTSTTTASFGVSWTMNKRTSPSWTYNGGYVQYGPGGQQNISSLTGIQTTLHGALIYLTVPGGLTVNSGCVGAVDIKVDAEL